ncbi:hypothetical protein AOLI_G00243910 [Acnodon oligacanthus]
MLIKYQRKFTGGTRNTGGFNKDQGGLTLSPLGATELRKRGNGGGKKGDLNQSSSTFSLRVEHGEMRIRSGLKKYSCSA